MGWSHDFCKCFATMYFGYYFTFEYAWYICIYSIYYNLCNVCRIWLWMNVHKCQRVVLQGQCTTNGSNSLETKWLVWMKQQCTIWSMHSCTLQITDCGWEVVPLLKGLTLRPWNWRLLLVRRSKTTGRCPAILSWVGRSRDCALEGSELLGSTKEKLDLPPGVIYITIDYINSIKRIT
jgi:hypothetical protein